MKHGLTILALTCVLFPPATWAQEAPTPRARVLGRAVVAGAPQAPSPADRPTYSFQVSLLQADVAGNGGYEGLSKNARKALEDLKDFLPFTSYQLLDFAWLRTSNRSSARIQGPGGRTYELTLQVAGHSSEESGKLFISRFDLRDSSGVNLDVEAGPLIGSKSLISTSFGMEEGETVVVGTSRLDSDRKALVVLLSAVPTSLSGG